MKTSDLKKYLQRIPAWPKEAQDELVRSMVEIEHRYSERYHVDDDERAALERSADDVRKIDLQPMTMLRRHSPDIIVHEGPLYRHGPRGDQ